MVSMGIIGRNSIATVAPCARDLIDGVGETRRSRRRSASSGKPGHDDLGPERVDELGETRRARDGGHVVVHHECLEFDAAQADAVERVE